MGRVRKTSGGGQRRGHGLRTPGTLLWVALVGLLTAQSGCLLPMRLAPRVEGVVLDAESGRPVAGARIAVRYESWHDDALPDRQLLGHAEAESGPDGRFRVAPLLRPGLTAWPLTRTQARVVGLLAEGYRCPTPAELARPETLRLQPALHLEDQRDSCRPIAARSGEAEGYMQAWRELQGVQAAAEAVARQRDLDRVLAARALFGFGQNCTGPVLDLALDPSGRRAALLVEAEEGLEAQLVELHGGGASMPVRVQQVEPRGHQSLAWTHPGELVLWEPATQQRRLLSGSIFGNHHFEVIWTAAAGGVAPRRPLSGGSGPSRPLEPADLNDEGDARWMGRAFSLHRDVDALTGLGRDVLTVTRPDGLRREIELPGEACGPRFGRAHNRIAADGRRGLDLRFVEGGCHALQIDLESGAWNRLDEANDRARCRKVRSVPAQHMHGALRGYMRDVSEALGEAGADPTTAYALYVDPRRGTRAVTRDLWGRRYSVELPKFPIVTPLRRIEVTVAGGRAPADPKKPIPAALPESF